MKNIRLISIMVAVLLGALATAIFQDREPSYQGRSLTKWIGDGKLAYEKFISKPNAVIGELEFDPDWQRARHAFKQMAPRAIPFLLAWAHETDSPRKVRIRIIFLKNIRTVISRFSRPKTATMPPNWVSCSSETKPNLPGLS